MEHEYPNEDEFPKLNIQQENEFKKLKLSIEHDANFFGKSDSNLPPEIEGQFLDYISDFENAFKNAKRITVYEKLGKPEFKPAKSLSDYELTAALNVLIELMQTHNMGLDVLCDYEDEDRLVYTFITSELFLSEIDDINVAGMITHFIYEDFHQNHKYDLENATQDFLKMFLNKKSKFFKEYHKEDATNHEELNNFRFLFKKFKMNYFEITNLIFDENEAKVNFNIDFWGKLKATDSKTFYSGVGSMTFKYEYGFWYVRMVELPIND